MPLFRKSSSFEFPGPRDRVFIVGSTGSGKSVGASWLFSESADFDKKPWVFVDYKRSDEEIIEHLLEKELANLIDIKNAPPEKPGIYVLRPLVSQVSAMDAWLWKVWERGRTGLVFDELYMVPEFKGVASTGGSLKSIYTQGRSKEIPVYGLAQRPVDLNPSVYSEANFLWEFFLKKKEDIKRVRELVPDGDPIFSSNKILPQYYSRWHDDKRHISFQLKPAPDPKIILDTIEHRVDIMRTKRKI